MTHARKKPAIEPIYDEVFTDGTRLLNMPNDAEGYDPVAELTELLRAANVKPYWNTHYLGYEARVRAFRARSRAFLEGRRVPFRHFEP